MSGTQGTSGTSTANAEDAIKDFWANRPVRPFRGRMFAGVAAGIGQRYGIDPVVIRVLLIISFFAGGAGLAFYLVGWLIMPREGDRGAAIENLVHTGRSSITTMFTLFLLAVLFPTVLIGIASGLVGLFGAAAVFGGFLLLHHHRSGHLPPPQQPTVPQPPAGAGVSQEDQAMNQPPAPGEAAQDEQSPPKWDPLGAAPFAWDLPEPGPTVVEPEPEPPAPRPRRGRVTLATIGLVIITGALLFALRPSWMDDSRVAGILLAVTGLGMVFGAFRGGARGLIPVAIILAIAGIVSTQHVIPSGRIGSVTYAPSSLEELRTVYPTQLRGTVDIDLTHLPATTAVVHTGVTDYWGDISVDVPKDAVVRGDCFAAGPDSQCIGISDGAEKPQGGEPADNPNGLTVVLSLRTDNGNVVINRV